MDRRPKTEALAALRERYSASRVSTIVDDTAALGSVCDVAGSTGNPIPVWIDVDCGMGRTGVVFGSGVDRLRDAIDADSRCEFAGLHVYDGHVHDPDPAARRDAVRLILRAVADYLASHPCPSVAIGGTPTFAWWARETDWECCPGTSALWDIGYGESFPELRFKVAAALITRVVSKPGKERLCLDLGHKAIASEMPLAERVMLPSLEAPCVVSQSEEHLVVGTPSARLLSVGDALVAYPRHICPSVALYGTAAVVRDGRLTGEHWRVVAAGR